MKLLFDDDLIEGVVFLCASGKRRSVPPLQIRRYHAERERAYSILEPEARAAAFVDVNHSWFQEWGIEKWLADIAARFPMLERSLQVLAFRKARHRAEEGGELYVNADHDRHGIVALSPERFAESEWLPAFLHHELMHLSDMVDEAFGYSPDLSRAGGTASHLRLIRERYRLLWDVTIDGRLTQSGRATVATREQRRAEFERGFGFLDARKRASLFESLWTGSSPRHRDLVGIAGDPRELSETRSQAPGAPCPLCGFATFDWVDAKTLKATAVASIRREFAGWRSEEGICHRCSEIYEANVGLELPATICL